MSVDIILPVWYHAASIRSYRQHSSPGCCYSGQSTQTAGRCLVMIAYKFRCHLSCLLYFALSTIIFSYAFTHPNPTPIPPPPKQQSHMCLIKYCGDFVDFHVKLNQHGSVMPIKACHAFAGFALILLKLPNKVFCIGVFALEADSLNSSVHAGTCKVV